MTISEKKQEVMDKIPHRDPFLFIDSIESMDDQGIHCKRRVPETEFFFKGHYPGQPVMPGVILCETIFQAGAIFLSSSRDLKGAEGVPVVTRVNDVKFLKMVKPGDELDIEVVLDEVISNVFFMKGTIRRDKKAVTRAKFACTLAKAD
jgi:3-hydroxyacyl-[acyl-carrier-protein] dehydratase